MTPQPCHTVLYSSQANTPETAGLYSDVLLWRKMSQVEGETQDMKDETEVMVYGEEVEKWQHWGGYQLLICGEFVLQVHCLSMNVCFGDLFQMMVYMTISNCLPITWLTRCSVVFWPELNTHPASSVSSFLRPGCISPVIDPLTSNVCRPHIAQEHIISTVEHTQGLRCLSLSLHMCTDEFMY